MAGQLYEVLVDTASNLFEVESQISEMWCAAEDFDEKLYEEDQDKALSYRLQWQKIKAIFMKLERSQSEASLLSAQSKSSFKTGKKRLPNLPKLDIIKFDGNAKSWLQFWGQFRKVHEDEELDSVDKFQYLLQAMASDSKAKQLVESYPPSGENYEKAVEALKGRFARDDVLIETYVRGLLGLMQEKGENKALSSLYDSLQTHLQALETLGVTKDKYASMLFPMIESALPIDTLRAWHRSQQSKRDLSSLMEFLRIEVESEEHIRLARNEPTTSTMEPQPPTACFVNTSKQIQNKQDPNKQTTVQTSMCVWCDKPNHSPTECHKAVKMSLKERVEYLKSKKACLICFKINHYTKKCKSYPKCLFCTKRHFTIMCPDLADHNQNNNKEGKPDSSNSLSCQLMSRTTLLPTLIVRIVHGTKEVRVRALIDTGAQRSYITTDIVQMLNLKSLKKEVLTHCLFGELETKKEECQVFDICVKSIVNNFYINMQVVEQNKICGFLPRLSSSVTLQQLRTHGITLTDSTDAPDRVSLLIGSDYYGSLITSEFMRLENNLTTVRTKLGWTVQGLLDGYGCSSTTNSVTSLHITNKFDISDLWTLESLGIMDPAEQRKRSEIEHEVLENFKNNININEEGRYQVSLPWRDVPRLQDNYDLAKKRLVSNMHRLTQLGKLKDYDNVFREWLQLNIIEEAPNQSIQGHYLPHHAVIKESSLTTKIRPVFDASAKDRNGISLNSCLEKGVNLLVQIPNLLINFRKHKIGVTADIAKAFLQISLVPEDRDYLRFLWWSNLEDDRRLTTYRHRRVVFGVTSSPFLLIATINHHLDSCSGKLKNTAKKLKESFYVDNCVTSVDSEEELYTFVKESKEVMLAGKFDLRGWISSPIILDENVGKTSILGVLWDVKLDRLKCNLIFDTSYEKLTKRSLLSVTQKVFDPLGIVCATTIVPKMIMQKAWLHSLTWDQELPEDLSKDFRKWLEQLSYIDECVVPRRFSNFSSTQCDVSLHVFCDASKDAYAACIFLRSQQGEHVEVSLVLAKSRVTPVKPITIPRLELIAATLATRLSVTAINSLDLNDCEIYYWTDSSVVLTWIKCDGPWSVFVSNRVKEITNTTMASRWRHVPGYLNPADLPSRGVHPKGLVESRWWEGPAWLKSPKDEWPDTQFVPLETDEERKKTGWFSACGCRGGALATPRGSLAALLRARAFALVSPRALSAYRARPSSDNGRVGGQYERAVVRPGTPLRLAGVFADGSKAKAPKYAQLIDPQGNELFVPINTKGELYEVCPEELSPVEWGEASEGVAGAGGEAAARAHRLPHLLSLWKLPARVRLLAGTVPIEMAHDVGDDLLLRSSVTEPVLVICTLPDLNSTPSSPTKQVDPRYHAKESLQLLPLNSNIKVRRTQLGFENEKRMFLSARLQKALTFCQLNVDNWIRQISYATTTPISQGNSKAKTAEELIKEDHEPVKFEKERKFTLQGLKIDTSRLFGKSEKVLKDIPDETEGSIIFLSKNELEHMNYDVYSDDEGKDEKSEEKTESEQFSNEKMHVFREDPTQKKNKWFKNLKLLKSTEKLTEEKITAIESSEKYRDVKDPFDPFGEKHSSIERYQDMAKLIEDRFGGIRKDTGTSTAEKSHSYKSLTTSSSDMGTSQCSSNPKKPVLTKSVSVQTGIPDSPYPDDSGSNMKHGRKNLSVDQINYCGSTMESNSSSGRKLKSLDENMLKKSSASKSSTNLERRQRIQPDLIPEKVMVKSESYNQIQSCEEINMFGVGSLYNDSDFEINYKQHSYITEKLCSEFHVKTKRVLSKSTSNLLHPKKSSEKKEGSNSNSMPSKTERTNDNDKFNFRKKIDKPRAPTPKSEIEDELVPIDISDDEPQSQVKLRRSISSIQKRKLPVIEDLPYGQVADAVENAETKTDTDSSSDNIYAEICLPNGNRTSDEENYDSSVDILANDPVICNVKKEVIIRNDERARQMIENQENPFRHIEVVVIEKTTDFDLDNSSMTSSDFDDLGGSKNDVSIAIDSWEREKDKSKEQNHAIRLEITSNMDDYPVENKFLVESVENDVHISKDSLSFSNSIHLNGTYPNEAIYDTLK